MSTQKLDRSLTRAELKGYDRGYEQGVADERARCTRIIEFERARCTSIAEYERARCIKIVEHEPELEEDDPAALAQLAKCSLVEVARATVRATKNAIVKRIKES